MKATIDTNVFVYALDSRDFAKMSSATELIEELQTRDCAIALQTCGELYSVLIKRFKRAGWEAAQAARNVLTTFGAFGPTPSAVERALAEASAGRFAYWDALMLASAHEAGCTHCFSEDMADGSRLGSVEVIAPFDEHGALSARARKVVAEIASG